MTVFFDDFFRTLNTVQVPFAILMVIGMVTVVFGAFCVGAVIVHLAKEFVTDRLASIRRRRAARRERATETKSQPASTDNSPHLTHLTLNGVRQKVAMSVGGLVFTGRKDEPVGTSDTVVID